MKLNSSPIVRLCAGTLIGAVIAASAGSSPCFYFEQGCGNYIACLGTGWQFSSYCHNTYCDSEIACPDQTCINLGYSKRIIDREREVKSKYIQPVTYYCVILLGDTPGGCCNCDSDGNYCNIAP